MPTSDVQPPVRVTTATFGPMCSSGAYFNVGHSKPRIKLGGGNTYLNDIPVYTGFAAVDFFLGATAMPDNDPRNRIHPGEFLYGGGHVIEPPVTMVVRTPILWAAIAVSMQYSRKTMGSE